MFILDGERILEDQRALIFLCYAKPDRDSVKNLYDSLVDGGFAPWMDEKNILPGEFWSSSIRRAIRRSDFFLACISKNSITRRGYLQKEIREGLEMWKEKLEDDIYLIPIRLEDCELPQNLTSFQCLNLFEKEGFTQLKGALTEGLKRRRERAGSRGGVRMLVDGKVSEKKPAKTKDSVASKKTGKDLNKKTKVSACELFGGRDAILRRMTKLVRNNLLKNSMEFIVGLEKDLSLPSGSLNDIATRGEIVDLDLFERLSGPLGILFHEALGSPVFDGQERDYWENEHINQPLLIASALGGTLMGHKEITSVELEFYVGLRVLSELAQA